MEGADDIRGSRRPTAAPGRIGRAAGLIPPGGGDRMRRWNGWGDPAIALPLPEEGLRTIQQVLGAGEKIEDAPYDRALASVPASRLTSRPPIETDSAARLAHARGQTLPDWIALRSGRIGIFPDGVAHPQSDEDVRALLDLASREDAHLIPYGGGTRVVGRVKPPLGDRPILTVDLRRMNRLLALDEVSRLATFAAGASGPQVEAQLAERGRHGGGLAGSIDAPGDLRYAGTVWRRDQSLFYGRI